MPRPGSAVDCPRRRGSGARRRLTSPLAAVVVLAAVALGGRGAKGADCSAAAVRADGTREDRGCDEVDPHDALRGLAGKVKPGKGADGWCHPKHEFMKGSRWLWNNWREVEFTANGFFVAPAENCDAAGNSACTWTASEDGVVVNFGGAGAHTLAVDGSSMTGVRDSDGDAVSAVRVN